MPKKRWIPTYDIAVKVSVPIPDRSNPVLAWSVAHGAVDALHALLADLPGAGVQIMHTGPGKLELKQEGGADALTQNEAQTIGPQPEHAASAGAVAEQRKEIGPQANDGKGLAPETATEEIRSSQGMEIPERLRRAPRREVG